MSEMDEMSESIDAIIKTCERMWFDIYWHADDFGARNEIAALKAEILGSFESMDDKLQSCLNGYYE